MGLCTGQLPSFVTMDSNKTIKLAEGCCAPTFAGMLNISRNAGYTQTTALNEYYDNSIDAGATVIITHIHTENDNTFRLVVIDNSKTAMTPSALRRAWQMAGKPEEKTRTENAIGKFDIGMKAAGLSLCTDITISSRPEGQPASCLYADVDMMTANNQFEPTELAENVDRAYLRKHFHASDIDLFLAQPSGTMVQLKNLRPEMMSRGETTFSEVETEISRTYTDHPDVTFFIKMDSAEAKKVEPVDRFYSNTPSSIKNTYSTTIDIYQPIHAGSPCRVIERVPTTRQYRGGNAYAGRYYEHREAKPGDLYSQGMDEIPAADVEKMKNKYIDTIELTMTQVEDDAYALEPSEEDNKGFHMIRGKRKTGSGLRLGHKFHDRESHACDRQRMKVRFRPSLDKYMGSTWNKMMRDGPLPQKVVGDTLYRIYKQLGKAWSKEMDTEIARRIINAPPDTSESETDAEESYAEIPQPPTLKTFTDIARVARAEPSPKVAVHLPSPPVSPVTPKPMPDVAARVRELVGVLSGKTLGERESALLAALSAYVAP